MPRALRSALEYGAGRPSPYRTTCSTSEDEIIITNPPALVPILPQPIKILLVQRNGTVRASGLSRVITLNATSSLIPRGADADCCSLPVYTPPLKGLEPADPH